MTREAAIIERAKSQLEHLASQSERPEDNRLDLWLTPEQLLTGAETLAVSGCGYLATITGIDPGPETGELEALYHFCCGPAVVTLRVRVPRDDAHLPTVCDLLPAASFFERELSEMFGITVDGTPNPDRLFLPDDWPDGAYPLRKDFVMEGAGDDV